MAKSADMGTNEGQEEATRSTAGRRMHLAMRLARGDGVRVDELADDYGCSRRTVFRDIRFLRTELGVETHHDSVTHSLHATLPAEYAATASECLINSSQQLAAAFALEWANTGPHSVLTGPSKLALESLRKALDEKSLAKLDRLVRLSKVVWDSEPSGTRRRLMTLVKMSSESHWLEVTHRIEDRSVETRIRIDSIETCDNKSWIVVGYSALAGSIVRIAASKIESLRIARSTDYGLDAEVTSPHFALAGQQDEASLLHAD